MVTYDCTDLARVSVKGTARIEYAAFRSTRRSAEYLQFLADRTVNTSVGETPWRTSAEAVDAGWSDNEDADW